MTKGKIHLLEDCSKYRKENRITNEVYDKIQKIIKIFGEQQGCMVLLDEYNQTAQFEQEYTRLRWTVYTALTTVSFAITGFALSTLNSMDHIIKAITFFFAWMIQVVATFFYWWMHKVSHRIRDYLEQLELILGGCRYTLRGRRPVPRWHVFRKEIQFKFHWVIYGITIMYLIGIIFFSLHARCVINNN